MKNPTKYKEQIIFLSLLVAGIVVFGLSIVIFNVHNNPFCPDNTVCMINGEPHVTISQPDSNVEYIVPPQSSAAYKEYAAKHEWSTTTPKTTWEKNDFRAFQVGGEKCFIASTSVPIIYSDSNKFITFNYPICPFLVPNFLSIEEPGVVVSSLEYGSQTPSSLAFRYWVMKKGESPESLINSLIKSLPSPLQREHCKLDSQSATKAKTPQSNTRRYNISPDLEYAKMLSEDKGTLPPGCYPYYGYFQVVENLLVYVSHGQDVRLIDPDSFRVETLPSL